MSEGMAQVSLLIPRLDAKPWGGRKLAGYGLDLPPGEPIGEALVTAGEAVIVKGDGAGKTLQEVVETDPHIRLGQRAMAAVSGRVIFPLLVKLIDAAENLSIQVHPDDAGAMVLDRLGKTEAWYVLAADPGAKVYLGLANGISLEDFMSRARMLDGSSARALRALDAEPGMTTLIPAGTVHALGAGVMVYEIQQPSDVTFRLDDWGRTDAQGNPREMHLEQGKGAVRPGYRPENMVPIDVSDGEIARHLLTACRYFALERLRLPVGSTVLVGDPGSPQVLTVLSGAAGLIGGEDDLVLTPGSSGVVWPTASGAELTATESSEVLRAWVPDLLQDIVRPALASGAMDMDIGALGGASDDVRKAMQS